jgi:hypothetical protein
MIAPENSIPALEEAVRQGADGVEIDIRRTADGQFILYHDDWILEDYGPGVRIEDLTLVEALSLDVGKRFGTQWRGIHPPLLKDVLRFAKANQLRLYLDIKTPGIYEEVLQQVKQADCMPLVTHTGGQVPKNNYKHPLPFIEGWNYTGGGEEDPEILRLALEAYREKRPNETFGIMADDARAWSQVLQRTLEHRPFSPFADTRPKPTSAVARKPSPVLPLPALLEQATKGETTKRRQQALWQLGTLRATEAIPTLEQIAKSPLPPKLEPTDYDLVFLKIGGACALARYHTAEARTALQRILDSPGTLDRGAGALALACFGNEQDIPTLATLVDRDKRNDGFPADAVLNYAGRFDKAAIPIYEAALERNGFNAKQAVFGLANQGEAALPLLRKLIYAKDIPLPICRRAALALRWMKTTPPVTALRMEVYNDSQLPSGIRSVVMP